MWLVALGLAVGMRGSRSRFKYYPTLMSHFEFGFVKFHISLQLVFIPFYSVIIMPDFKIAAVK